MQFLSELIAVLPEAQVQGSLAKEISGVFYDSRKVTENGIFVCISGFKTDGHQYIPQAITRGATVIVAEKSINVPVGVTVILVANTRVALALLANAFYGYPSRKLRLIGITGTNGKTSVTYLIRAILQKSGQKVGLLGTIANLIGEEELPAEHTTPEAPDLQHLFQEMAWNKVTTAVMEVSSHALELERVTGSEFDVAVFTNLTQDHLDFHLNLEAYLKAKTKLFASLQPGTKQQPKYAVLNGDDPYFKDFREMTQVPVISYGVRPGVTYQARDINIQLTGTSFVIHCPAGIYPIKLKLAGQFNVYNALAAFAVGMEEGIDSQVVQAALDEMPNVPGRFEQVNCGQDFAVIVDYAHTPDGLENVLKTAQAVTTGRVITVFGCGGDRDRTKRPIMGRIAGQMSDYVVITSDNPRSENPRAIIADVEPGLVATNKPYQVLVERQEAIAAAISKAQAGDIVVIAGKGHENYQLIGEKILSFDDREVAKDILKKRGFLR